MKSANLILDSASGYYPGITTQTDVTATRAVDGTVYHNTGTTPIFVNLTVGIAPAFGSVAKSDANANPVLIVSDLNNPTGAIGSQQMQQTFVVLPGNYYKVNALNGYIDCWIEYK